LVWEAERVRKFVMSYGISNVKEPAGTNASGGKGRGSREHGKRKKRDSHTTRGEKKTRRVRCGTLGTYS